MSATDEQFAAAWNAYYKAAKIIPPGDAERGRTMFAALKAHCPELFAKPQGLNLLQEVTLRLMIAFPDKQFFEVVNAAEAILALGEPQ